MQIHVYLTFPYLTSIAELWEWCLTYFFNNCTVWVQTCGYDCCLC